jgi:hypothetical protein
MTSSASVSIGAYALADDIGTAVGSNAVAYSGSVRAACAFGQYSCATGVAATAVGSACQASGNFVTCVGDSAKCSFENGTCVGAGATAVTAGDLCLGANATPGDTGAGWAVTVGNSVVAEPTGASDAWLLVCINGKPYRLLLQVVE